MKPIILIISVVAFSLQLSAQVKTPAKAKTIELGNIVSDPASVNEDLGIKLGLPGIKDSKSVLEIRLFSNIGFPGAQCIVLQYDKSWKATKYKLNAKDSVIKSTLKPAAGIDNIVKTIIASNVFSLPSQGGLNSDNYKFDLTSGEIIPMAMTISDAACYYIQFKAGDSKREYKYCDPKQYAAFYKGQREYADFTNILKAFAKLDVK